MPEAKPSTIVYTVGHGTRPIAEFIQLLQAVGIRLLVDVRTAPGSRKHPQFGKDALAAALREQGIAYEWKKELGGWRKPRPDSRHRALRSPSFRGYADHMETKEFDAAVRSVIETARETPTAVMCAESLWWRCHRRMLADALTARGCSVFHIMSGEGQPQPHRLHPAGRIDAEGGVIYDRSEPNLLDSLA
ncbi:MAG TPA: DUF488 domain-containing protein [Actinomycetota bacterium]